MKNKNFVSIKEAFNLNRSFFDSRLFYYGEWAFGEDYDMYLREKVGKSDGTKSYADVSKTDILYLNSLSENGKNLYMEFIKKCFYDPLQRIYKNENIVKRFYPHLSSRDIDGKRYLTFNRAAILCDIYFSLFRCTQEKYRADLGKLSSEEGYALLKEALRDDRKIITDVSRNGRDSEYYKFFPIFDNKPFYINGSAKEFEFFDRAIDECSSEIMGIKYLPEVIEQKINPEEFMKCFNYDALCLIMAYSAYLDFKENVEHDGSVVGSALHVFNYLEAVKKIRETVPNYNIRITIPTADGKLTKISINDLEVMVKELTDKYPQILEDAIYEDDLLEKYNISKEYADSLSPMEYSDLLRDLMEKERRFRSLKVNWELLPKEEGQDEPRGETLGGNGGRGHHTDKDAIIERYHICSEYISSLHSLFTLKGINEFDGYTAYVFGNGRVLLEKVVNDNEYSNATYIMNIENFFDLSKLSRPEIIRGLSDGSIKGVRRIYHTKNIEGWKSKIQQEISGDGYSGEILDIIYKTIEDEMKKGEANGPKRVLKSDN